jgi:glycerophosphoryl diester phosphodiesterase
MQRIWIVGGAAAMLLGGVTFNNASWLAPAPQGRPGVLAHRGVHQTFRSEGLTNETCTATHILAPTNPYLENTLASMRASFAAGADVLELDIHPTTDGEFAVFHDWTLDCRTDGHGVTRNQTMTYLKTLDVGYGYTTDGGKTFPFRRHGVGLMPTLEEVFAAFPGKQFLINIKSNDANEADKLIAYLKAHNRLLDSRLWVYAEKTPGARLREIAPSVRVMAKSRLKACALRYLATGWLGIVPQACRGQFVAVPLSYKWLVWGWPNCFLARMKEADAEVLLARSTGGKDDQHDGFFADPADLNAVPDGFSGLIGTNMIEVIGPAVRRRWPKTQSQSTTPK